MDVLIKNLKLPIEGERIEITIHSDCAIELYPCDGEGHEVIEIPSHGDLIDTEEAINHWDAEMMITDRYSMRKFFNGIPIVLEANK